MLKGQDAVYFLCCNIQNQYLSNANDFRNCCRFHPYFPVSFLARLHANDNHGVFGIVTKKEFILVKNEFLFNCFIS